MRKTAFVSQLMLTTALVLGALTTSKAQKFHAREYARSGPYYRSYPNYTKGYRAYPPPPVVITKSYSPFAYGPRYYSVPPGSISITFGGNPYYYYGGSFYRPYGGYYRPVFPPVGIHVGILPPGFIPIYIGPDPYYFGNAAFYRRYDDHSYEVVDAPMGAQLSSLPKGARSVRVNGEKFYELNGTYFKEDRDSKGRVVYTVVGKNGEIENSEESPAPPQTPKAGDKVTELPENSKLITLNGEKLYVAPDNTYYHREADGTFTIVGTAHETT
jgi:hypothetical protein